MSRDASGNYTLPGVVNPVVSGTPITITWGNSTLADLQTAMTDSLDRNGRGSMLTPLKLTDGTAALPSLTFANDTNTGIYRVGSDIIGVAVGALEVARWSAAQFSTVLGSAAAPAWAFTGDLNTGLYSPGADQLGVTIGGTLSMSWSANRNVTFAAPASGTTLTLAQFTGGIGLNIAGTDPQMRVSDAGANGAGIRLVAGNAVNLIDFLYSAAIPASLRLNNTEFLGVSTSRNITFAAPASGITATFNGVAGGVCVSFDGITNASYTRWLRSGTALGDVGSGDSLGIGATTDFGITARATFGLTLGAGGALSMYISSARNIVVSAPSSGVGFAGTGFAGSDAFVYNGGTSGSFRVNTTGVPYATSAHNNAGAVTGATNQYFCSGTYTPTLTNIANLDSSVAEPCQWMRVGNVATVSGSFQADPTAAATFTSLGMSLPIASNFADANGSDCGGTAVEGRPAGVSCAPIRIAADSTNDRVTLSYTSIAATNVRCSFSFTYLIL